MRRRVTILIAAALVITAALSSPTYAGMLIGGSTDGTIYDVDPMTGLASNPRDTGLEPLIGLAFSPGGTLYGADEDSLYRVSIAGGDSELLGTYGPGVVVLDFDFESAAPLIYGCGEVTYEGTAHPALYTIDPNSTQATLVGETAAFGSLAVDRTGRLFLLGEQPIFDQYRDVIFVIEKDTGATVSSVMLDQDVGRAGVAFTEEGRLFLVDGGPSGTDMLYTLDSWTGVLTPIGDTGLPDGLTSLAYIPEPGILALFTVGGAPLFARRQRRS